MAGTNNDSLNLISDVNSTTTPLGANVTFTGVFVNVTGYTSVTCLLTGDQIVANAEFQWSEDGITVDDTQPFFENFPLSAFDGGITAHATTRAKYFRILVLNGATLQGASFSISTMLRRGAPVGFVSPILMPPDDSDDAQTVKATMYARRIGTVDPQYTQVQSDTNGFLIVVPQPAATGGFTNIIPASLTPVQMTLGLFDTTRDEFNIVNDVERGSLYIRCFTTSSLTNYHFKIPPQHTFQLPFSWRFYSGQIWGIWDEVDAVPGNAYVREVA